MSIIMCYCPFLVYFIFLSPQQQSGSASFHADPDPGGVLNADPRGSRSVSGTKTLIYFHVVKLVQWT